MTYIYRGREFDEHGRTVRGEDLYDSTRDQHYDRTKDPASQDYVHTSVADKILDALAFEDERRRNLTSHLPRRIQLRRTKGWRKPEGAIVVARPSRWGNPFRVGSREEYGEVETPEHAVKLFRDWMEHPDMWALPQPPEIESLHGRDLACWCPLDQPCHADVLLDLANRRTPPE